VMASMMNVSGLPVWASRGQKARICADGCPPRVPARTRLVLAPGHAAVRLLVITSRKAVGVSRVAAPPKRCVVTIRVQSSTVLAGGHLLADALLGVGGLMADDEPGQVRRCEMLRPCGRKWKHRDGRSRHQGQEGPHSVHRTVSDRSVSDILTS
jgi:hypothetical protein